MQCGTQSHLLIPVKHNKKEHRWQSYIKTWQDNQSYEGKNSSAKPWVSKAYTPKVGIPFSLYLFLWYKTVFLTHIYAGCTRPACGVRIGPFLLWDWVAV